MAKLDNDQYYTPIELAKRLVDITFDIVGIDNIKEIIEPSAGTGSFSSQIENCIAYDIEPKSENIIEQDFLLINLPYKKGRLIIGNPPFGKANWLSVKFFQKAITLCDYIAFVQPISQYNCNDQMYQFDLAYSENLGEVEFSDRSLKCCFNIYKRPESGKLNHKPIYKIEGIEIYRYVRNKKRNLPIQHKSDHDIVFCRVGASIGKECKKDTFCGEFWIKINHPQKDKILELLREANWKKLFPKISVPYIAESDIVKYLWKNGIK